MASLTIGLFWINPEKFLSADRKTTAYSKAKGIATEPEDYQSYLRWLKEMTERVVFGNLDYWAIKPVRDNPRATCSTRCPVGSQPNGIKGNGANGWMSAKPKGRNLAPVL